VIKHVPLKLYIDDTYGNVSKKWNKPISFISTLAGLSLDLVSQDYHPYFSSTSNTASTPDLAVGLVDEL
ncbi:hypothetical protein CROQUDRAFT_51474, partial [Cronartium quercuum f. sp. fusiforme G11]